MNDFPPFPQSFYKALAWYGGANRERQEVFLTTCEPAQRTYAEWYFTLSPERRPHFGSILTDSM